jgi:hypothetical protein
MSAKKDLDAYEASAKATQQQILDGMQASQKWILEQVRTQAEATPPALPGAQKLAAPASRADLDKLVDDAFDFTEKLLANQREFTHKLVAVSAERDGDAESSSGS